MNQLSSFAPLTSEAVVAEVSTAFDGVSRNGGITLHQAEALDNYSHPDEVTAAASLDTEACWQDVPIKDLERVDVAMCFMNDIGFRYYLPAYMLFSLRHYATCETQAAAHPIYRLGGKLDSDLQNYNILSSLQKLAVKHYLEYMAYFAGPDVDCEAAKEALDGYWGAIVEDK